jgi:hydrogenase large subunit
MTRLVVGPFNRVEGDLEVALDIADGRVKEARVTAGLYRGFETILEGRPASDALVVAPRVCGICSLSQSVAAARALADAGGIVPTPNGERVLDLALAAEVVADHLTHFHLFFMPDFARAAYADQPWAARAARFAATRGEAQAGFLPARARFLHLMGSLMGKWPHSLAVQPGGVTRTVQPGEKAPLIGILRDFRAFLENSLHGGSLESFAELDSRKSLEAWGDRGDAGLFAAIARDLDLGRSGTWTGPLMSSGAYSHNGKVLFTPGVLEGNEVHPLDRRGISEDTTHSWLRNAGGPTPPAEGVTEPDIDKPDGYTWAKAPRLAGKAVEVGACARQAVDGHPLILSLLAEGGASVEARVLARLVEVARLIPTMETWIRALEPGRPFCAPAPLPDSGRGVGLVEAARGTLSHWIAIEDGRLTRYQIVSPTTWNFSPRDGAGIKGPLETALEGTPVAPGETAPLAVQHVVRSFDPCMACTVH